MTPPARRRATALLATGAMALLVALGGPVAVPTPAFAGSTPTPGSPEPTDTPTEEPDQPETEPAEVPADPLAVTIDRLAPSVMPAPGKSLHIAGSIRNTSDTEWTELTVYALTSVDPITSAEELTAAVASDPRTDIGDRIVEPGLYVDVPDLQPGDSTRFSLVVPRDQMRVAGTPGVYWAGVHVLGTSAEGRLDGADGRARTFLPLVPARNPGTELALGVQFRETVVRDAEGRLTPSQGWNRSLRSGRLRDLLDLARGAGAFPLTWVVDPAVVEAADSVSRGNPEIDLAPERRAPAPEEGTPEEWAQRWLDDFVAGAQDASVLALPYGDLDVSAAVRHGSTDVLSAALGASTSALADQGLTFTPVVAPPDGVLSPDAVAELDPGAALVLAPQALVDDVRPAPVLNRADGGRILVAPSAEALEGPQPSTARSALSVRQRLLAGAALHALSRDRDQPFLRFLPAQWDPGKGWRKARFFRGLDVPWLTGVGAGDLLSRSTISPIVDPGEDLGYPKEAVDSELPLAAILAAESLITEGALIEELLTEESNVDDRLTRQALLTPSLWSRSLPGVAAQRAVEARDRVDGWLDAVTVRGPDFVTMSSEAGTFQVTIVNGLDQGVTVGLRATVPGSRLELTTPEPVVIPPRGRGGMRIKATMRDIGVHLVTLQPVTAENTPLGEPSTLNIRTSQVGFILWIVMAVGGAALFLAIVLRIVRRVRRRRRTHGPLLKQGLSRDTA